VKILDKYILKTFLTTFASVFVILFFIFILQTVWLFISELAGKDLDFILIVKFLLFSMPNIVPMVLPLSILLASIMTFGDLSENYEFAAMKSAGVSLQRAMKSLVLFILILSVAAFAFANNVIPYSQYKFTNFRRNIAQVKPAMAIAEGQFSEVGNYTIKVDKKSGENGRLLQKITIFKKSDLGIGNTTVIKAQSGELMSNESSNILQLIMYNGSQYEDIIPKNYMDRNKVPFAKTYFKKYTVNMDLSKLNKSNDDDGQDINTNKMLNLKELRYTLDSLNKNYNKSIISFTENIHQRSGITAIERPQTETAIDTSKTKNLKSVSTPSNLLTLFDVTEQLKIIDVAKSNIIGANFTISNTKEELAYMEKNINGHWVSVYDKFVMAYACLLMFFIGAPLGAIIRKGGLGLPIVFAVLIFITFHFVNTFGRKVAEENGISAFLGSWMSSLILTPLAILLTYRATNDIGLINIDVVIQPIQKLFAKLFPQK
jgi:lipopolysaccharide export system permease protein